MSRVYNFSAGPAVLPEEVLKEAAAEMLDYNGTGMSVMEMSHRSKAFEEIIQTAEQDIRDLLKIPDNYKVLFLQGGAHQQFFFAHVAVFFHNIPPCSAMEGCPFFRIGQSFVFPTATVFLLFTF